MNNPQTALVLKSDGRIYATAILEEVKGDIQDSGHLEMIHEMLIKKAISSAVVCADQEQAGFIWNQYCDDPLIAKDHPYVIPGLTFTYEHQYYKISSNSKLDKWMKCPHKEAYQYQIDRGRKVRTVALLSLENKPEDTECPKCRTKDPSNCHSMRCPKRVESVDSPTLAKALDSITPEEKAEVDRQMEKQAEVDAWKDVYMWFNDGEGWIKFSERMSKHFSITRKN